MFSGFCNCCQSAWSRMTSCCRRSQPSITATSSDSLIDSSRKGDGGGYVSLEEPKKTNSGYCVSSFNILCDIIDGSAVRNIFYAMLIASWVVVKAAKRNSMIDDSIQVLTDNCGTIGGILPQVETAMWFIGNNTKETLSDFFDNASIQGASQITFWMLGAVGIIFGSRVIRACMRRGRNYDEVFKQRHADSPDVNRVGFLLMDFKKPLCKALLSKNPPVVGASAVVSQILPKISTDSMAKIIFPIKSSLLGHVAFLMWLCGLALSLDSHPTTPSGVASGCEVRGPFDGGSDVLNCYYGLASCLGNVNAEVSLILNRLMETVVILMPVTVGAESIIAHCLRNELAEELLKSNKPNVQNVRRSSESRRKFRQGGEKKSVDKRLVPIEEGSNEDKSDSDGGKRSPSLIPRQIP